MRWEIYFNEATSTVTVIDAPEGHTYQMPEGIGASIGELTTEPGTPFIISKNNSLLKTWLTERFSFLGIEQTVEKINHLPML